MNDPNRPSGVSGSSSDPEENTGDKTREDYPSEPKTDEERVPAEHPTRPQSTTDEADTDSSTQAVDTSSAGGSDGEGPPPEDDDFDDFDDDEEAELGGRMTFLEHLDELRKRILYSLIAIITTFVVAWIFREPIFQFLSQPILNVVPKLVVIKPTEPFTIYLKVSFTAAIFMAIPVILIQTWLFIAPGLYRREKKYALPFLIFSTILFVLGGMFAYYIILPPALRFLLAEFGADFQHMISAVEFFDFELLIIVGMGVIFQLPILVAFLSIFGLITPRFLWKNFRYAFLIMTIVAAVVSPTTDPFNLFLWTGPMVLLYMISIAVSWIFKRRRDKTESDRW